MDARRAQDIIRHIIKDEDYGMKMVSELSAADSICLYTQIIPECIEKAKEKNNYNDTAYFQSLKDKYRPLVIENIKKSEHIWIAYCDTTGYPYMVDKDIIAIADYSQHEGIEKQLEGSGFELGFVEVNMNGFMNEVAHMYRNGYNNIRFINGRTEPLVVTREELYEYDQFFNEEYVTNPGLQAAMIEFFQEFRKRVQVGQRESILKVRELSMIKAIKNAEFMVPCTKEENDENIEISFPFIDLTDKVTDKEQGEQVIAVPVFTDGYEMEKCYKGHTENFLYKYEELLEAVEELKASGIVVNFLGISYYISLRMMRKFNEVK